jgi:predicted transcriptional regulator
MLADKNMKPLEIARLLGMSESLVKEYLELHTSK